MRARRARAASPFVLSIAVALAALAPARARAELSPEDRAAASSFFEAGAQAFDAGQFLVAAEAFLKAHAFLKSPALLFSAAQAYRRQYVLDTSPEALRSAVHFYREYVRADPSGKRREDALVALTDLAPLEARLGARSSLSVEGAGQSSGTKPGLVPISVPIPGSSSGGPPPPVPDGPSGATDEPMSQAPRATRLLLSANPASAEVSIDGGAFVRVPAVVEVKAGPHAVRARSEGYRDEELSVPAVQNELVARHIVLQPKAGRLLVTGTSGARVSVDGQVRASLPMDAAIAIDPGEHFITVARPGYHSLGQMVAIDRDREAGLKGDLAMKGQRVAAWTTLGVGIAGALAGGAIAGFMLDRNSTAKSIEEQRASGTLSPDERDQFNSALQGRNKLALAAGVTGGAAGLVLLGSAGLFLFDEADVLAIPSRGSDGAPPKPRAEFTVGLGSARLRVTF